MTQASKSCRALEVIVQARWVESFNQRVETLGLQNPTLSATECRMRALAEACEDFGWSQKDLRNKLCALQTLSFLSSTNGVTGRFGEATKRSKKLPVG
jgi:hypothetical protein